LRGIGPGSSLDQGAGGGLQWRAGFGHGRGCPILSA
jgi:hypothetical protein